MFKKMFRKLFNEQKFFRRLILLWSMGLITYFTMFLMNVDLLIGIGAAGATVATSVIGILATVVSFYQWHRNKDDDAERRNEHPNNIEE